MDMDDKDLDWSTVFLKGGCPADLNSMQDLDFTRASGDWYLQKSNDYKFMAMPPASCFHIKWEINKDGTFKALEEAKIFGKTWIGDKITGLVTKDAV